MTPRLFIVPPPTRLERLIRSPADWTSRDGIFSLHVVPRHRGAIRAVESGFSCCQCREEYRVWLWPRDEMVMECGCLCACHEGRR